MARRIIIRTIPSRLFFAFGVASILSLHHPSESRAQAKPDQAPPDTFKLEKELARYWAKKRAIKVVQRRRFPMSRRIEITIFAGTIPNDPFLVYLAGGARVAYSFNEDWGLELSGAYTHGFDTMLRKDLEDRDALVKARLRDHVVTRFGLAGIYSPIYGKFAFANRKLGHFKLYFLACAGAYYARPERQAGLDGGVLPEWGLGLGIRFFIDNLLSIRLEFRQRMALKETAEGESGVYFSYPSEISLGLGFAFGRGKARR